MDRTLLKRSIDDWQQTRQRIAASLVERSAPELPQRKMACALTGVRRGGKTTQAIQMSRAANEPSVLYYNFEDPLFYPNGTLEDIDQLLAVGREYSSSPIGLFIADEIQNVEGWERWVRTAIDQQRFRLIVTGSSAKLLSTELATSIAGRALETTVWPLSYAEFLQFSNLNPSNRQSHLAAVRQYLQWGAFPEVAATADPALKRRILSQYLADIVHKDVVNRNEIRSKRSLDQLVVHYLTNLSSLHAYSAIRNAYGIATETAAAYTRALCDAFLVFEVERYHPNLKVQSRDAKKVYVIDTGLRNVGARSPHEDDGKLLENIVYIALRRRGKNVTYYRNRGEVDFVITERHQPVEALQVCFDFSNATTQKRELSALGECCADLGLQRATIVTHDHQERLKIDGLEIDVVPVYRWLLDE